MCLLIACVCSHAHACVREGSVNIIADEPCTCLLDIILSVSYTERRAGCLIRVCHTKSSHLNAASAAALIEFSQVLC